MKKDVPVKIGLMAPLTGLVQLYGPEISHAGIIACNQINRLGGVLGRPLELVIGDDGSLPDTAVPCALKLIEEDGCDAIIGNLLSNSRIAVNYEVANYKKIPYLNFSFYEGSISGRYFFNFAALPNQQIDKMVPYMAERFGPKFYFAGSNYEWPRGSIDAAKSALNDYGGEIVGEEYFEFGTSDFHPLLEKVKRSGADVFVPYFAGHDQINLLTQFTQLGLKEKITVVMGHYDEAMVSNLSEHVREGFYSSNTYFMSIDTEKNHQYLKELAQLPDVNGIWPNGNGILTNFGEGTYNCVMAYANAVNLAGTTEPEAVVEALLHIQVNGLQGTLHMEPSTHHSSVNSYLSRCLPNGQFEIIESFGEIEPRIPARYLDSFSVKAEDSADKFKEEPSSWHILGIVKINKSTTGEILSALYSNVENALLIELAKNEEVIQLLKTNEVRCVIRSPEHLIRKGLGDKVKFELLTNESSVAEIAIFTNFQIHNHSTLGLAFDTADIAIIVTSDKGKILNANKTAVKLFGYPHEEMKNHSVNLLIPPRFRVRHSEYIAKFVDSAQNEKAMSLRSELYGYKRDGSEFPMTASIAKITSAGETKLIVTIRDITHQKSYESQLIWSATHDALTQLPNRALIRERIEKALERSSSSNKPVILMFLDLDAFKFINDNYGHDFGDLLLKEMSVRLINTARPGDTVARFGGDEFLILCERSTEDIEDMSRFIESIVRIMRQPVVINGIEIHTSASIGVAMGYGGTHSPDDLLKNADVAMYSAKEKGRDGWMQYDSQLHEQSRLQVKVAKELTSAISEGKLTMYLQPIVDMKKVRIVGAEALCRWQDDDQMISPAIFIPIAEMTGLIKKVGLFAFEEVCKLLHAWHDKVEIGELEYISLNVSAFQLDDINLPETFKAIAERYKVHPKNILLEVTETAIVQNFKSGISVLQKLGDMGFSLAIDDFGTGYSSLGQLIKLPVDKIKIDKMFVDDVATKEEARLLIQAIEHMAHGLKMKIVAEGVENTQQSSILEELNIDYLQGFLFYRPMPAKEFIRLLERD
ncbi:ABC transporter substrate-binding protein [Paraneptunicella aestuarii]|uniref:ABC transporter substrate-binding protein n=1 Tax=Paraneptunicella aestuarii TaxID=2831148 RepID=UPI001E323586|nr:ABC transporter substrate-binding protein [Paraneptunicella aestuarii]UAA38619.1 ABC transporter substrate-binding protein [Paraneptunicella aestuarii]